MILPSSTPFRDDVVNIDSDQVLCLVRAGAPVAQALPVVQAALRAERPSWRDRELYLGNAVPTPQGAVFDIANLDTATGVGDLVSALESRLYSELGPVELREVRPDLDGLPPGRRVPCMTLGVRLRGHFEPPQQQNVNGTWIPDAEARRQALTAMLEWTDLPDVTHVYRGGGVNCRVLAHERRELLELSDEFLARVSLLALTPEGVMRQCTLAEDGFVTFAAAVSSGDDWSGRAADAREMARRIGSFADYALFKRSVLSPSSLDWLVREDYPNAPELPQGSLGFAKVQLVSRVPDVFGMQVLSAHPISPDARHWQTTTLPGGQRLVEARDAAAWYAGDVPDGAVLERGRDEWSSILLRDEDCSA